MISVPFFLLLCFIFKIAMDFFQQEALDAALQEAVRQVQTGHAQNVKNGNDFVNNYLCKDVSRRLNCSNIVVSIQKVDFSANPRTADQPVPTRALPIVGGAFCNSGPSEFLLVTAIYTAPGIAGTWLPNLFAVSFDGGRTQATMSQVWAVTEDYPAAAFVAGAAPAC